MITPGPPQCIKHGLLLGFLVSSPTLASLSAVVALLLYGIIEPYLCAGELQNSLCQYLTFASG